MSVLLFQQFPYFIAATVA